MYCYLIFAIIWMHASVYLLKKIKEYKDGKVNPMTVIFFDRTFVSRYACILWSVTTMTICLFDLIVVKFIYDDIRNKLNEPHHAPALVHGLERINYRNGHIIKFTSNQEYATVFMLGFCLQFGILWFINIICAGIICAIPFIHIRFNEADKIMKSTQIEQYGEETLHEAYKDLDHT